MKSCLQLNIGPALTQTLHESDSIEIYSTTQLDANGNPTASSDNDWTSIKQFSDVSLKSNILLQTAASQTLLNANYKCQFKAFTQAVEDTKQKIDGIPIAFNNFKDGITRVSLKKDDSFTLFISLPASAFGVMMFYKKGTAGNNTITLAADGTLTQLNSESSTGAKNLKMSADGIYIIHIDEGSTFIKIQTLGDGASNLFFSNLDIIPTNTPLNPQLGLTNDNDYEDVLSKIKEYDSSNKFYYNYITDSSTLINFNDDDSTETLMTSDI